MSHRLTIKGQVTIPKEIREFLGLKEGNSAVEFSIQSDGSVRISRAADAVSVSERVAVQPRVNASAGCDRILAMLSGAYV